MPARILFAKTGLDGHWRGPSVVTRALRDAGFEVIMIGMATAEEIASAAIDEDVDLLGLNVGGHVKVAEGIIDLVRQTNEALPIFVGGVIPPWAKRRLEEKNIEVYPPGSQLEEIVDAAKRLTGTDPTPAVSRPARLE